MIVLVLDCHGCVCGLSLCLGLDVFLIKIIKERILTKNADLSEPCFKYDFLIFTIIS